jgi:hypothetical protein
LLINEEVARALAAGALDDRDRGVGHDFGFASAR